MAGRIDDRIDDGIDTRERRDTVGFRLVIVESPFAAPTPEGIEKNLRYARACMRDCLRRRESPYASHALLTQPGVLDDMNPDERRLGMEAGFAWGERADASVFYVDRGWSRGMYEGLVRAFIAGRAIEFRSLRFLNTYLPHAAQVADMLTAAFGADWRTRD